MRLVLFGVLVVLVLGPVRGDVLTKDIADEALEDVDGIIQETDGITVEEYTDDGNQPVPPENREPIVHADSAGKRGRRFPLRRDSTEPPIGSLHRLSMNPEALSVTSFLFNPTSTYSPWVDRIFGSRAVYHNRSSGHSPLFRDPLSRQEVLARSELFRRAFSLPPEAITPACSIEMLGFGRLEVDFPLKENVKHGNTPSVGEFFIRFVLFHENVSNLPPPLSPQARPT